MVIVFYFCAYFLQVRTPITLYCLHISSKFAPSPYLWSTSTPTSTHLRPMVG